MIFVTGQCDIYHFLNVIINHVDWKMFLEMQPMLIHFFLEGAFLKKMFGFLG